MMGCCAEATGLSCVCFVVINLCALSANRVDFWLFCFIDFTILLPPPPGNADAIMDANTFIPRPARAPHTQALMQVNPASEGEDMYSKFLHSVPC